MGITSFGHNKKYYYKVTFEMTKEITDLVYEINPNAVMTYVSGNCSSKQNSKILGPMLKESGKLYAK